MQMDFARIEQRWAGGRAEGAAGGVGAGAVDEVREGDAFGRAPRQEAAGVRDDGEPMAREGVAGAGGNGRCGTEMERP